MTKWKDDFIALYRKDEGLKHLTPTPQKVLDFIAEAGDDVVNGNGKDSSVMMLVCMIMHARDPALILEVLNETDSEFRAKNRRAAMVASARASYDDPSA